MYSSPQLATKYLKYYATAYNGNGHGMHSPFVFNFILNVLNNRQQVAHPHEVEAWRKQFLKDDSVVEVEDLGAGSRVSHTNKRVVSKLAASALKPKKYGQMLYRLVHYYKPNTIIELGTSLGITTAYLAMANSNAQVTTIEGSLPIHQIAKAFFKQRDLKNITPLQGNFDAVLPALLQKHGPVDVGYIDGNHRYGPTMDYFRMFLNNIHNNSILIFDDIHWSSGMEQAWNEIKEHPAVRCTVDIFFMGFVFFRSEFKQKQHFAVRF